MRRPLLLILIAAFCLAAGSVLYADTSDLGHDFGFAADSTPPAPFQTGLLPMFESAANKYNVPLPLMLSLAYFGSGFENRGAKPTIEGGYGVTALRYKNYMGSDTLSLGAQLTGYPVDTVKSEPAANILACAAVLDYYAKMWQIDRSKGLEAWLQPVIEYAGLGPENSKLFAWEVFKSLKTGFDNVNAAGEAIHASAQSIGSIDLPGLVPQTIAVSAPLNVDYPGASWTAAASCNYDSTPHTSDTVVIHTMEGSLAGTINWFQNCDHGTLGPSSCTYNIGKDGTIVQMVREYQTAWDVGCYNSRSVGIEHEGSASDTTHPVAMYNASAALTRDICDRWGIPKQKRTVGPGVIGHVDVTNCCCGTHTDPGVYWDWTYYMNQVNANNPTDVVYIEPRGQNSGLYSEDASGLWGNSAGWCNTFDTSLTSGGSRYFPSSNTTPSSSNWMQVKPNLAVPGGTYRVWIAHFGSGNISTDSIFNITLTNCTAQTGDIKNGQTTQFQANPCCQFSDLGTLMLTAGQTQPTVKFTYSSGNVNDSSHRWNIEAFRFSLVPTSSTLTLNASSGGTVSGAGSKTSGTSVTATATPNTGFRFVSWTTGGFNGTVVSTSASYALTMPGQGYVLYANFAQIGTLVTTISCPASAGALTGGGSYGSGQTVTVSATANTGYTFSKWTSGSCGGTLVTTNPSYSFTLTSDTTLYANFTTNVHNLSIAANPSSKGSVSGDSGTRSYGTSCTVVAAPNSGAYFAGWSTDADGGSIISKSRSYTFSMPDMDYTLYANFTGFVWTDGFESYSTGGTGSLDSNDSGGPNAAASNPWWGPSTPNGLVVNNHDGINPHSGSKLMTNWVGNCLDYVNLAWRLNGGNNLPGSFFVDWWFYDAKGPSNNTTGTGFPYMADSVSLQNYKNISRTADYGTLPAHFADPGDFNGIISLGCAREVHNGWDYTKYQARVLGASGVGGQYGTNGWINLPKTRSIGWRHCRILVAPAKANNHNDISFYIDDMNTALLTTDSVVAGGFNLLETQEEIAALQAGDSWPYWALYDDFAIGSTPGVLNLAVSPSQYVNGSTVTASWTGIGAASYLLKVDDGSWVTAGSPYTIDVTRLAYGPHTVYVKAVDSGGNEGIVSSVIFTVDRSSIRNWSVMGFYPWGSSSSDPAPGRFSNNFFSPDSTESTAFAKLGMTYNGKTWFNYSSPSPIVDFDAVYGSNKTYGVSYVFTWVVNSGPAIPSAYLTCGSDDGIKVFFNGNTVWSNDVTRGLTIDSDLSSSFMILPGSNRLLIKTTQGAGGESVQARLCNADRSEPTWLSQLTLAPSDDSAPTGTLSINGGAGYTSNANVTLLLSARDDLSGVSTMSFSNDNITWSTPEAYAIYRIWPLIPGDGTKTVYARFTDKAGNTTAPISASIILGPRATVADKISDLWALPNDPTVPCAVYGKVVTAAKDGTFWVEEPDRYSAVKVMYDGPVVVNIGDSVDVVGYLSTGTQRVITAVSVTNDGPALSAISPLAMVNSGVGGGNFNTDTPSWPGGRGAYNVGLLVKIAGSVTGYDTSDPQREFFWLEDGSGLTDGLGHTGLKVNCGNLQPPTSGQVIATGVIDIETINGGSKPVLYATGFVSQ